ncbi:hypothetical protein QNM97_14035 [Gordonia sp. L191]|uniref:hypothetical protein n=1 Tax=Gordonia sp. L191 TaxID=2982699 RepID=UPI0024C0AC5B|nr:hypothetical protein [Gordonia sp. L191]WHU45172.1 hypothetical protein QNM97_14035 [Gordonia sp. L191]
MFRSFIAACLAGDADENDIDDWVDRWHDRDKREPPISLDEFLGFTAAEGRIWASHPDRLTAILNAHRELHLIYTEYPGFGWSLRSPQLPGLAAGQTELPELLADTNSILKAVRAPITDMFDSRVHLHEEHAIEAPDGAEYLVRWMTSGPAELSDARADAASRLQGAVINGLFDDSEKARQPVLITGERLLIGVAGSDVIALFEDQLGQSSAVLSQHRGDDVLITVPFGGGPLNVDGHRWSIEDLGLSRYSKFEELADKVIEAEGQIRFHAPLDRGFSHQLTSM